MFLRLSFCAVSLGFQLRCDHIFKKRGDTSRRGCAIVWSKFIKWENQNFFHAFSSSFRCVIFGVCEDVDISYALTTFIEAEFELLLIFLSAQCAKSIYFKPRARSLKLWILRAYQDKAGRCSFGSSTMPPEGALLLFGNFKKCFFGVPLNHENCIASYHTPQSINHPIRAVFERAGICASFEIWRDLRKWFLIMLW